MAKGSQEPAAKYLLLAGWSLVKQMERRNMHLFIQYLPRTQYVPFFFPEAMVEGNLKCHAIIVR